MGNCQAAEAATALLQHQDGKIERLYLQTRAGEVMRDHPGHHVALAVTTIIYSNSDSTRVRLTKLRLLGPKETLVLGHVYRLVTSTEVVKALNARKRERWMKQKQQYQQQKMASVKEEEEEEVNDAVGFCPQDMNKRRQHNPWQGL